MLVLHACDLNLVTEINMAREEGVKPEPVGGAVQHSNKLEAMFRAQFVPMCDKSPSPIVVSKAVTKAAAET